MSTRYALQAATPAAKAQTSSSPTRPRRVGSEPMAPELGSRGAGVGFDFSALRIHPPEGKVLQPKLEVGAPDDRFEREADQIADQVMRMPAAGVKAAALGDQVSRLYGGAGVMRAQRACAKCEREDEKIRGKAAGSALSLSAAAADTVPAVLATGGQPLPAGQRTFMETSFGHDFSAVRVHADARAAASAAALGARAYTAGQHIVFGAGRYAPEMADGRRLLAHELTHVVQQRGSARLALAGKVQRDPLTDEELKRLQAASCPSGRCHAAPPERSWSWATRPGAFGPGTPEDIRRVQSWLAGTSPAAEPAAAKPEPAASPQPSPAPLSGGAWIAQQKIPMAASVAKTHWTSERQLIAFMNEYIEHARTRPELKAQYDEAVEARARILVERQAAAEKQQIAELEREIGRIEMEGKLAALRVPVPEPIRAKAMVGEVAIPIAESTIFVAKFVPYLGEAITLLEAASGRGLMGLGAEISTEERVIGALLVAIPHAGKILRSGKAGAGAVVQIARSTGASSQEVLRIMRGLRSVQGEEAVLREALALVKASKPLSPRHMQAMARAERALGGGAAGAERAAGAKAAEGAGAGATPPTPAQRPKLQVIQGGRGGGARPSGAGARPRAAPERAAQGPVQGSGGTGGGARSGAVRPSGSGDRVVARRGGTDWDAGAARKLEEPVPHMAPGQPLHEVPKPNPLHEVPKPKPPAPLVPGPGPRARPSGIPRIPPVAPRMPGPEAGDKHRRDAPPPQQDIDPWADDVSQPMPVPQPQQQPQPKKRAPDACDLTMSDLAKCRALGRRPPESDTGTKWNCRSAKEAFATMKTRLPSHLRAEPHRNNGRTATYGPCGTVNGKTGGMHYTYYKDNTKLGSILCCECCYYKKVDGVDVVKTGELCAIHNQTIDPALVLPDELDCGATSY